MKPIDDVIAGLEDTDEILAALHDQIRLSGVQLPLPLWIKLMEDMQDGMADQLVRILMADAPAEMVDEQAKAFVDSLRIQRVIYLYEMVASMKDNPVNRLVVPK